MDLLIRPPKGAVRKKKRLGRGTGSGLGSTSGKGNKGQKARSGGSGGPYLGFEGGQVPLYRRLATRGFSNARYAINYLCINLNRLEKFYSDGESVNLETLAAKGIISRSEKLVKILGTGELSKKLSVSGLKVSGSAKEKIEKSGGSIA